MGNIANAEDGRYLDAVDINEVQPGRWFSPGQTITLSVEIEVGEATIAGHFYGEITADPRREKGISRVILPVGCLHTLMDNVTLPEHGNFVQLDAATSGAFTVTLSFAGAGHMRFCWEPSGGGGDAPNTITVFGQDRGACS